MLEIDIAYKHEEHIKWKRIVFEKKSLFPDLFVFRNVGNSIKCKKNLTKKKHPHIWDKKSEQGNRGYIVYRLLLSLSTIWRKHLHI